MKRLAIALVLVSCGHHDQAKRDAVYAEAQEIIMDSALWFPVHNQVQTVAYRAEKKGYHFARADWVALFYDVTKA